MLERVNVVWFRNGLRLHDNGPLHKASVDPNVRTIFTLVKRNEKISVVVMLEVKLSVNIKMSKCKYFLMN